MNSKSNNIYKNKLNKTKKKFSGGMNNNFHLNQTVRTSSGKSNPGGPNKNQGNSVTKKVKIDENNSKNNFEFICDWYF